MSQIKILDYNGLTELVSKIYERLNIVEQKLENSINDKLDEHIDAIANELDSLSDIIEG